MGDRYSSWVDGWFALLKLRGLILLKERRQWIQLYSVSDTFPTLLSVFLLVVPYSCINITHMHTHTPRNTEC